MYPQRIYRTIAAAIGKTPLPRFPGVLFFDAVEMADLPASSCVYSVELTAATGLSSVGCADVDVEFSLALSAGEYSKALADTAFEHLIDVLSARLKLNRINDTAAKIAARCFFHNLRLDRIPAAATDGNARIQTAIFRGFVQFI